MGNSVTNFESCCLPLMEFDPEFGGGGGDGRRRNGRNSSNIIPSAKFCKLSELYEVGNHIASGTFGAVFECKKSSADSGDSSSEKRCACKTFLASKLSKKEVENSLRREVRILRHLSEAAASEDSSGSCRRYIPILHDVIEDTNQNFHLIMDLCSGGTLYDGMIQLKHPHAENQAAFIMLGILRSVQFLHSHGVIHRDLKPQNILFASPVSPDAAGTIAASDAVRIADFGISLLTNAAENGVSASSRGFAGTACYIAPEILRQEPYSHQVDVWSLGIILYTLLSGFIPFHIHSGFHIQRIRDAILYNELLFPGSLWDSISHDAKLLVKHMLCRDPMERITIADALDHPWILRHTSTTTAIPPAAEKPASPLLLSMDSVGSRPIDGGEDASSSSPTAAASITMASGGPANGEVFAVQSRTPSAAGSGEFERETPESCEHNSEFERETPESCEHNSEFERETPESCEHNSEFERETPESCEHNLRTEFHGVVEHEVVEVDRAGTRAAFRWTPAASHEDVERIVMAMASSHHHQNKNKKTHLLSGMSAAQLSPLMMPLLL